MFDLGRVFRKIKKISATKLLFLKIGALNKDIENFLGNLGHNIFRLFDILPNFPFATSETNRDY